MFHVDSGESWCNVATGANVAPLFRPSTVYWSYSMKPVSLSFGPICQVGLNRNRGDFSRRASGPPSAEVQPGCGNPGSAVFGR